MTVSLTAGEVTVNPMLLLGWESSSESRNVVHQLLGTPIPHVTLQPADSESATLTFLCADVTEGWATYDLLKSGQVVTLAVEDLDTLTMDVVLAGPVSRQLDPETLIRWLVTAEVRQVA